MSSYLLGALLVLAGVVFLAIQVIRRGPLSSQKRGALQTAPSLEPTRQGGILDLRGNWPGYMLILIGAVLLLIVPA
jgi:hypothetical protein